MIQIDLAVRRRPEKLTSLQFLLLFLGILIGTSLIVGIGLILQWNSLNNLADEIGELGVKRDSLEALEAEIIRYKDLKDSHSELMLVMEDARKDTERRLDILRLLRTELEPGMKFLSCRIGPDSVITRCLSPSNVKVARYLEELSRSGLLRVIESEPQGTRQGLIEHRVLLKIQ